MHDTVARGMTGTRASPFPGDPSVTPQLVREHGLSDDEYARIEGMLGRLPTCRPLDTPVTGGNVSFYNESPAGAVDPSPVIGMIGMLKMCVSLCQRISPIPATRSFCSVFVAATSADQRTGSTCCIASEANHLAPTPTPSVA